MKKIVRTVWIGVLTGVAFLAACTTHSRLSKAERKQLRSERSSIEESLSQTVNPNAEDPKQQMEYHLWEMSQRQRLNEINEILGDTVALKQNQNAMGAIKHEMDSLSILIDQETHPLLYGPPINDDFNTTKEQRRNELIQKINDIRRILQRREGACIYGSPEVMERYKQETQELRKQQAELEQALHDLDNE